jgi:hypothetical protein
MIQILCQTLSIVWGIFKIHSVSEIWSISIIGYGGDPDHFGPLITGQSKKFWVAYVLYCHHISSEGYNIGTVQTETSIVICFKYTLVNRQYQA